MIGSLISRMGMAEKLSVAQLQKAVQDGTLPAYVGVPLIQDKMQKEQAARNAVAGMQQQGQPPIAEQVMQAAQAQEAQGIDAVPSNLPEQGFAGGGIVAFAEGGDTEDDETDDSLEERRQISRRRALTADAAARMQQGIESGEEFGISAALPQAGYKGEGIKAPKGLEELRAYIVGKESGGRDFDAKGNPLTSPKGAKYAMQVMEGTARDPGFGINPAKDKSASEYNRVGNEYVNALYSKYQDPKLAAMAYNWGPGNVDKWLAGGKKGPVPEETQKYVAQLAKGGEVRHLDIGGFLGSIVETPTQQIQSAGNTYSQHPEQAALGINTPAEAYAWNSLLGTNYSPTANMLGGPTQAQYAEGAKNGYNMQAGHVADAIAPAIIGAFTGGAGAPVASAGNALGNQYELGQMRQSYLQNPTAFNNTYGQVKGINYAGGGIVALAGGGDLPTEQEIEEAKKPYVGYSQLGPKAGAPKPVYPETSIMDFLVPKTYPVEEAKKAAGKKTETKKETPAATSDADIAAKVAADLEKEKPVAGIDTAIKPAAAPEDDIRKKYLEMLTKREAGAANQRSIDNYTALLQAGLGMMASKSLTPLGAIGEGASSGIAAKLAAEKTRAAEEAATLKGYGNLYDIEQTAAYRKELAGQGHQAALKKQQFGIMANLEQKTRAQITASLDKSIDATSMTPEQKQAKVDQLTAQALSRLPTYTAAYKAYNGFDYNTAPVIPGVVDYSSTYGLTPKPKQ